MPSKPDTDSQETKKISPRLRWFYSKELDNLCVWLLIIGASYLLVDSVVSFLSLQLLKATFELISSGLTCYTSAYLYRRGLDIRRD